MSRPDDWAPWGPPKVPDAVDPAGRRLGPASFSAIFEISARILRRHAAALLLLAIVFMLAGAVLDAVTSIHFGDTLVSIVPGLADGEVRPFDPTPDQIRALAEALLLMLGSSVVFGLLSAIAGAGIAWIVQRDYHGYRPDTAGAVMASLRRAPTVIAMVLVSTLAIIAILGVGGAAIALALTLLAPSGTGGGGIGVFVALVLAVAVTLAVVYLSIRWSLATVAVALEPIGPVDGLRRSWRLTGDHAWRTLGVMVAIGLTVVVLGTVITQLLDALIVDGIAAGLGSGPIAETLVGAATTILFAPATPVVMAVLYFDLRVRREDWDLPPAT